MKLLVGRHSTTSVTLEESARRLLNFKIKDNFYSKLAIGLCGLCGIVMKHYRIGVHSSMAAFFFKKEMESA